MLRTRSNTDGNKLVIFSGIASYYGDNYIISDVYVLILPTISKRKRIPRFFLSMYACAHIVSFPKITDYWERDWYSPLNLGEYVSLYEYNTVHTGLTNILCLHFKLKIPWCSLQVTLHNYVVCYSFLTNAHLNRDCGREGLGTRLIFSACQPLCLSCMSQYTVCCDHFT